MRHFYIFIFIQEIKVDLLSGAGVVATGSMERTK